jgi:hypothetical protein
VSVFVSNDWWYSVEKLQKSDGALATRGKNLIVTCPSLGGGMLIMENI